MKYNVKRYIFFIWLWLEFYPFWYCPLRTGGGGGICLTDKSIKHGKSYLFTVPGYSRKNPNRWLRICFFELPLPPPPITPGNFHFFTLSLEIPDKTKLKPWIFHKIVRSLGNSTFYFFDTSRNSISSTTRLDFFWNSPMIGKSLKNEIFNIWS